jgi:hypothetical protein
MPGPSVIRKGSSLHRTLDMYIRCDTGSVLW